eukprot:239131-Chlamydomonas_euryale.AAC.1
MRQICKHAYVHGSPGAADQAQTGTSSLTCAHAHVPAMHVPAMHARMDACMPPLMPSLHMRMHACAPTANASGRMASSFSPLATRALNSCVFARRASSLRLEIPPSSAVMASTRAW